MAIDLPRPLTIYLAAKNRHDIDGMLLPFSTDATVRDEGEVHRGSAAILAWMERTTRKYRVTVEVADATANGNAWRVAGIVSGNYWAASRSAGRHGRGRSPSWSPSWFRIAHRRSTAPNMSLTAVRYRRSERHPAARLAAAQPSFRRPASPP